MTHLTHTGYQAGRLLCNANKDAAGQNGDRFIHAQYARLGDNGRPEDGAPYTDICPECAAVWADAMRDE